MSKFVKVKTELRDFSLIKRALDDLKLEYVENVHYVHRYSRHNEPVAFHVKARGADFGLRDGGTGVFEAVGDDMQMSALRQTMNQIAQRYAYHMVLNETAQAGFDLVEEQVGRDQVIRMTVRRWS